jgi:hypothetical protein
MASAKDRRQHSLSGLLVVHRRLPEELLEDVQGRRLLDRTVYERKVDWRIDERSLGEISSTEVEAGLDSSVMVQPYSAPDAEAFVLTAGR